MPETINLERGLFRFIVSKASVRDWVDLWLLGLWWGCGQQWQEGYCRANCLLHSQGSKKEKEGWISVL
jgi:hypothetical protein